MLMIWKCLECGSVQISNNVVMHQMDYCECGHTAVDLEGEYMRIMNAEKVEIIERVEDVQ